MKPASKAAQATQRKREQRQREAMGEEQYKIRTPEGRLITALTVKRMSLADALDKAKVEAELSEIIGEWVAIWLRNQQ